MVDTEKASLISRFGPPLEALLQNHVRDDVDPERTLQLSQILRNERYWQGKHYHYPTLTGRNVEWSSATGNLISNQGQRDINGLNDYVLNYYYGDGLKLVGVLGRMPNAKAIPDGKIDVNVKRARKADSIISKLWAHWGVEQKQSELVLSLFKNGVTFGYTPFVANRALHGTTSVPIIEMRSVQVADAAYGCAYCGAQTPEPQAMQTGICAECGGPLGAEDYVDPQYAEVPEVVDRAEFANGSVELHLCTPYTVSTPFYIRSLDETPWLWYEFEQHKGILMAAYPQLRAMQGKVDSYGFGGSNASTNGVFAREVASSPGGLFTPHRKNRWRFSRYWLQPSMYEVMDGDADGRVREELYKAFPRGLKVSTVNGHVVDVEEERLTDVWAACKPTVSEYLYAPPLGNNYIKINDLINDGFNIMAQTAEKGIPINLFDPQVIDPTMFKNNPASVMDFWPALPGLSGKLRDSIWSSTPAELNPTTMQLMSTALEAAREISGITNPLFGGDAGRAMTLGEAELRRNQALQPHNTTWNFIRGFWSRLYENGVRQLARNSTGKMYFSSATGQSETLDMEDAQELLEGGWSVQCDEAIPMTWGQKRAQVWQMIEAGPPLWQMFGLQSPNNLQVLHDTLGNGDYDIPGLDARDKVLETIRQLLQEQPIQQPSMDPMAPPMLLPSIPADEFEDDHLLSVQAVREWCQSEQGREAKRANEIGYANVIAWGRAHLQMVMAQQAQMMPGPDGAPPPGPGGAPPSPAQDIAAPPPPGVPGLSPAPAPLEEAPLLEQV